MATAAEDYEGKGDIEGEYKRPDMKGAIKIFKEEIAPKNEHIQTIKGDLSDPHKRIKDDCNCPRKVLDFLMTLDGMEDAKRDHWLLAMREGMRELKIFMPTDLVTQADGSAGADVIPIGERDKPKMATLSDDEEFEEASEEELAEQKARPSIEAAQAEEEELAEAAE